MRTDTPEETPEFFSLSSNGVVSLLETPRFNVEEFFFGHLGGSQIQEDILDMVLSSAFSVCKPSVKMSAEMSVILNVDGDERTLLEYIAR